MRPFNGKVNKCFNNKLLLWTNMWVCNHDKWKWNESGFRPPLCTYRLNWARRTSWGWWDDWDDTVLQTQDSKFEPWRSEAEHATSRSRRLPTILTFTRGWGRNNFVSFKPPRPGTEPRTLAWKAAVLTTTLGPPPCNHDNQPAPFYYQPTLVRRWPNTTWDVPASTTHWPCAGLMMGQRRKRWVNTKPADCQWVVFVWSFNFFLYFNATFVRQRIRTLSLTGRGILVVCNIMRLITQIILRSYENTYKLST